MTTPINIVSLDQGKNLYKDWTLEIVDDTPDPTRFFMLSRTASSVFHWVRSALKPLDQLPVAATRFTAWHAH